MTDSRAKSAAFCRRCRFGNSCCRSPSSLAATKPEVLRALPRIHAEELARHYKGAAKRSGETGKLHAGAVTFVQRFGSSLNVHVHLHTCALDRVYVEDADAPRFVPAAPPNRAGRALSGAARWAHFLPREEVGPTHVALPNHDPRRGHREALRARANLVDDSALASIRTSGVMYTRRPRVLSQREHLLFLLAPRRACTPQSHGVERTRSRMARFPRAERIVTLNTKPGPRVPSRNALTSDWTR